MAVAEQPSGARARIGALVPVHSRQRHAVDEIAKLIDTGVLCPIVERAYPFDQASQALAHVEGGRAKRKVVITMA
jgi:NADPH:quinone reductase-like Zn-dependent oxidoreductase